MRVLCASAEFAPAASVGGLGAAVAGLVAELRGDARSDSPGVPDGADALDVEVVIPDYGTVELADPEIIELAMPEWAQWSEPVRLRRGVHRVAGPLTVVAVPAIERDHPYLRADGQGWPDNDRRFLGFSQAVAAYASVHRPDLVHLNDWHTASVLAALDESIPTVLSIHNLVYQGQSGSHWLEMIGPRSDAFDHDGCLNPLAGGVRLADAIIAVSPNYAREILTPAGGAGLHDLLRERADRLSGIVNGIDTRIWDPQRDPHLPEPFSAGAPNGRSAARRALLERVGWSDDGQALVVVVSRLTDQKGIDLVIEVADGLESLPARLVVLGSGEADLVDRLRSAAERNRDRVAFIEGYDEGLSHLMFAGGDIALIPSRFEPCGLTQMQAMRYGALPVVTAVGGLVDTVVDIDHGSVGVDGAHGAGVHGPGVVVDDITARAVTDGLARAVSLIADRDRIALLRRQMMERDWSWRSPAREYRKVYTRIIAERSARSR